MRRWFHLRERDDESSVDDELRERSRAQVAVPPVPEHQAREVVELGDREGEGRCEKV